MKTRGQPSLIPREILLGNPARTAPRLSPDGAKLAYLAPHGGKLSVWAGTIGKGDDALVVHDPARPIRWVAFRGDGRHVLYVQDRKGDENFHLFQADLSGGSPGELTPGEKVRAIPLAIDARFPDQLLFTSNARDPRLFDVYRLDLGTLETSLDTQNLGDVAAWKSDAAFVVRAALATTKEGPVLRVRDSAAAQWRELDRFSSDDADVRMIGFSRDGASLDVITSASANAARLVRYDLKSGSRSVLLEDTAYDVADVYVDPATREPVAAAVLRDRLEWTALDPSFEPDLATIRGALRGEFGIADASDDGRRLLLREQGDTAPERYLLYDRDIAELRPLFESHPALASAALAPMKPVSFPARDGLTLHGYLTLPEGLEPRGLPTVLFVHGGPWHRDRFGFSADVQWLANRGYAVLQVNFRGSTGYGKAFRIAGNRQWAGTMRTDLLDARDWAVAAGIADPARFGIFGGSYGGYAVLTALAFTPGAFTCGIDVVGPSNLTTFLESIPPYWETMRQMLHERIGDDPALLREHSPLFRAAQISAPLLVVQGANDPRVPQRESDQMVEVLRRNGIAVTYVVFADEGHGFADPANSRRFSAAAEAFLAQHLGGRLEPAREEEQIEPFLR